MKQFYRGLVAACVLTLASFVAPAAKAASPQTIDRMVTGTFGGYAQSYAPGGSFMVFPLADYYVLNDGSSWDSGAGVQYDWWSNVKVIERSGSNLLQYVFNAPADGVLYSGTDYSYGDHSAQGSLGVTGSLVLEAQRGARQGVMKGYLQILSNDATWYDTFNYYSAAVGQSVYFETTYTLSNARFTRNLFNTSFSYNEAGLVDFTQLKPSTAIPEPANLALMLAGLGVLGWRVRRRASAAT